MIEKEVVLEVKNLKKYFPASHKRVLKAVDDVSFTIHKGETFGIVGESGCGKTTCGKTCTGILTKTDGQMLLSLWMSAVQGSYGYTIHHGMAFRSARTHLLHIPSSERLPGSYHVPCTILHS